MDYIITFKYLMLILLLISSITLLTFYYTTDDDRLSPEDMKDNSYDLIESLRKPDDVIVGRVRVSKSLEGGIRT